METLENTGSPSSEDNELPEWVNLAQITGGTVGRLSMA